MLASAVGNLRFKKKNVLNINVFVSLSILSENRVGARKFGKRFEFRWEFRHAQTRRPKK
jgi:hypothetical protein